MARISIHAYQVVPLDPKKSTPLEQLIDLIDSKPDPERVRLCSQSEVKLEAIAKTADGLYLMNFVRLRFEHGPGRGSRNRKTVGFNFRPGEGFGEETAALYDPATSHMLVQYNHFGVRAGRIGEYLSLIDDNPDNQYELVPRFDEEVERKLARKQIMRSFRFKTATRRVARADKTAGMSLTSAVSLGGGFGADMIEVKLIAGGKKTRSLDISKVYQAIGWLQARLGVDESSVDALEVSGKDDADTKSELLDLLGHRMKRDFTDLKLGADLRYPIDERWRALERAYNGWRKNFQRFAPRRKRVRDRAKDAVVD